MGKIFSAMIGWFIKIRTNPVVAAIGTVVVETLSRIPPEVPRRVIALVTEAAAKNEDNRAKFIYVLNKIKAEFPDLQESLIRTMIESSVLLVKKGTNG